MQNQQDEYDEAEYASFWRRLGATLLDCVIFAAMGFALGIVAYILSAIGLFEMESLEGPGGTAAQYLFWLVVILALWAKLGGTPGKLLLGLRIVHADTGENIGVGRGLLRYIGYFISGIPLCLGYFWMCWDERNQTWHDKLGKSVVVRIR